MRRLHRIVIALAITFFTISPQAKDYRITEHLPDARAKKAISALIKAKLLEASNEYNSRDAYDARWLKLSDDVTPYLFIIHGCGSGGCTIRGFHEEPDGWSKVFDEFGGESIEVLPTSTNGHADLRIDNEGESKMGGPLYVYTLKWIDGWYGDRITHRIFPIKEN